MATAPPMSSQDARGLALSVPRTKSVWAYARFRKAVPLRDRCSFGLFPWLISQALSVTYMAVERRLYLERNCRLPESPAHSRRRNREGPASSQGLNSQRGFGPAVEPRRKSRPRSTSLHGSSPCKCQRLSTLRWDRLPPSRPSTKSGARAGGRRLSDRRLHRWLAGTSASAPSSHGAADLLGLNRAHICVRNQKGNAEEADVTETQHSSRPRCVSAQPVVAVESEPLSGPRQEPEPDPDPRRVDVYVDHVRRTTAGCDPPRADGHRRVVI